ncbi:hypothetical protein CH282_01725 [Rhodococcus sp. 06-418-1B]|nr:hypothetical protein CH282_01725 [Rhodococcus sp. 06-418-1B]
MVGKSAGLCVVGECGRKVSSKKHRLCDKHYQALWKYGDPAGSRSRQGGTCDVADCGRKRSGPIGLCHMHKMRLQRTGSVEKSKPVECSDTECTRSAAAKGLCTRHYDKARGTNRDNGRTCAVAGCDRFVKARGRCPRHYSKLQRLGALASAPSRAEELAESPTQHCVESGCQRPSSTRGRCAIHHSRFVSGHNMERLCRGCGSDLTGQPRGRRWCGPECRPRCTGPACDRAVTGRGLCSTHLKQRTAGTPLRPIGGRPKRAVNGPCDWCGELVGAHATGAFCSSVCRGMARRHADAATFGACAQCGTRIDYLAPANGSSRRLTPVSKRLCDDCRHRSASLYLSANALRARDGDACSLCGLFVPENAVKPHPLAAEVDHVLPISMGGTHDPVNLALAHKTCNIKKGNRPPSWKRDPDEVEPLLAEWRLFGPIPPPPSCSVEDCDRRVESSGVCSTHRWRLRKYGSTDLPVRPERPSHCTAADCDRPVRAKELCRSHYAGHLRAGTTCTESSCERESNTRGLCKPHYNRWLSNRKQDVSSVLPRQLKHPT